MYTNDINYLFTKRYADIMDDVAHGHHRKAISTVEIRIMLIVTTAGVLLILFAFLRLNQRYTIKGVRLSNVSRLRSAW
jgi:hypothetical protein